MGLSHHQPGFAIFLRASMTRLKFEFVDNLGRGAGALFPTLAGYVSEHTSLGTAISIFGSSAYLIMILGALFLPETRGKQLDA